MSNPAAIITYKSRTGINPLCIRQDFESYGAASEAFYAMQGALDEARHLCMLREQDGIEIKKITASVTGRDFGGY